MGYQEIKFEKNSVFLVTGAAGFIGSNLCEALTDMGYEVFALDDLSTGREENITMFQDRPNYTFIREISKILISVCSHAKESIMYYIRLHGDRFREVLRCLCFMNRIILWEH